MFQDFEDNNGTPQGIPANYSWDAWFTSSARVGSPVNPGGSAVSLSVTAFAERDGGAGDTGGTEGIQPMYTDPGDPTKHAPVDLSGGTTLYLWVYDTQGGNTVQIKLRDSSDVVSGELYSADASVQNTWTKITWPLNASEFNNVNLRSIKNIEIYEYWDGLYYYDDIGWE